MSSIGVGDEVEWTSQVAGVSRRKRGVVVAVISRRMAPLLTVWWEYHSHEYCLHNCEAAAGGGYRDHASYLVAVRHGGPRARLWLYWPRVMHLRKVMHSVCAGDR